MMGSSSGTGSGSRYLDPQRIFELVIRRRPRELLDYLDSIPGASRDFDYQRLKVVGRALLTLASQPRSPSPEEDMQMLCWAQLALFHATNSRFCAPQMVGNPSNTSDAGHYAHPHNSSSYSGRMLTQEPDSIELRHAAMHNQLSAYNSRIHGATFPPLRESSSDVISFPTRRARVLDETSAFNSETHASAYVPLQANSTLGPYMHPHNSSSYYRRMLNHEPDSNELIRSAASNSRTAATLFPLQENFDDVHRHAAMHNPLSASSSRIHAAMHNPLSASSSRIHAAMLPPLQTNTMINFPTRHAGMRDETSASNSAREVAELSRGRLTPQMLMRYTEGRPTVDIKGKRPAAFEVDQINAKILRLNVASVITPAGVKSAAGVLIRDGSTAQFMTASCFRPILYMDPALLFAAACCEGIKNALSYEPTTIVLESHQVPLLEQLAATRSGATEAVQLNQYLGSSPPYFIIRTIPEESNRAACQLVRHALQMEVSKKVCKDPPDWLVPYLDQ